MKNIRIGTRNSALALWQAREVARNLQNRNYKTDITPIESSGDKDLSQPLYAMGITGVFTRDLDIALLNKEVDIAVHSLKDVPTILPENLEIIAYLERDFYEDILIRKSTSQDKPINELKVATSSLRRRAFWSHQYPNTTFFDIRGNVQTRLKKLEEQEFDATLLSLAGIKRLKLELDYELIPFMLNAPSQGVVCVVGHKENTEINEIVRQINHRATQICVEIERTFLNTLEGGCTAPIGALATMEENNVHFCAALSSLDGKTYLTIDETFAYDDNQNFGEKFAHQLLANGGKEVMQEIKKVL